MSEPASIKGVSQSARARLAKLGLHRLEDLLLHLPLRYIDETRITPIAELRWGEQALVQGEIVHAETQYRPRKALICQLRDDSGLLTLRFLHFYPGQVAALQTGKRIRALGEPRAGFFGAEMVHPECKPAQPEQVLSTSLTPVYPTTAGISQATLRKLVARAMAEADVSDWLPAELYRELDLPDFAGSLRSLHSPLPGAAPGSDSPARRRLAFDELLAQQISMRRHYARRRAQGAPELPARHRLTAGLLQHLPFSLTPAQQKVFAEISSDLARPHPMQRLLQGDVGSGKTVVAALAALQAIENGWQAAIMAPTEILAEQHYRKICGWLQPLGVQIAWLSGSRPGSQRQQSLDSIASGAAQLAVGTHALFQAQVRFSRLGLAIVDEQHRFGVHQRLALREKGGQPHQLMMSATPIPRTLAMSYYADLDVSVIDALPPGRTPVSTRLVAASRRQEVLERVRASCQAGRQAYWVCPLIEESEALQLQTALDTCAQLTAALPELRVGLVHGRMKPAEKQAVMQEFLNNRVQLLVATTVIEVGVDVPNASLMVIEHAERMGLSQLHQLRGRVGRGAAQSACILLFRHPLSDQARARLRIVYENSDGFEIARADLQLRGPGEFLGVRQSGVPMLKIADLERDADLLEPARRTADRLLKNDPALAERHLQRWLGQAEAYVKV